MRKRSLFFIAVPLLLYSVYTVVTTFFIRVTSLGIRKKVRKGNGIMLTFDDGPNPLYTPVLLDLLARHQIQAVFFVVGKHAEQNPGIIRRMHEEGHSIGIHHYEHISTWRLTPEQTHQQISRTAEVIKRITGSEPVFYRPPWGRFNLVTPFVSHPYTTIMWTHIIGDWKVRTCNEKLAERLRDIGADGSIVVLHDDGSNPGADDEAPAHMLHVLESYIREAIAEGIRFIPPDELTMKGQEHGHVH
ncbi:polysaccharide deacetylase family protein [Sporosarcina gallistercoris]|uniref:Polysaccharide deacetylase family protein n=1 Tax=Sporosarcina gallistercoris TaxID=2762245 RepID=A0ABR8PMD6_9BACL|nr:polysaccharide deacetylase family protein [Sporosarcina gallistercoris]MBD7909341.1 polysaccharide deacetylase family protein [Sporosarcina gallistercoris]